MGRTLDKRVAPAYPPGLYQELNIEMMEGLWYALAAAKHPEAFTGNPQLRPSLQEIFDKHLADVTWADFWHAFPYYELRENGHCLDELDALGLLLASNISRSRFQRHFEELASSPSSSSSSSSIAGIGTGVALGGNRSSRRGLLRARAVASSSAGARRAAAAAAPPNLAALRDQEFEDWIDVAFLRGSAAAALMPPPPPAQAAPAALLRSRDPRRAMQQQQQLTIPQPYVPRQQQQQRRRRQRPLQQQQQHVAYVSPAAPGRTTATTRTRGGLTGLNFGRGLAAMEELQTRFDRQEQQQQQLQYVEQLQEQLQTSLQEAEDWQQDFERHEQERQRLLDSMFRQEPLPAEPAGALRLSDTLQQYVQPERTGALPADIERELEGYIQEEREQMRQFGPLREPAEAAPAAPAAANAAANANAAPRRYQRYFVPRGLSSSHQLAGQQSVFAQQMAASHAQFEAATAAAIGWRRPIGDGRRAGDGLGDPLAGTAGAWGGLQLPPAPPLAAAPSLGFPPAAAAAAGAGGLQREAEAATRAAAAERLRSLVARGMRGGSPPPLFRGSGAAARGSTASVEAVAAGSAFAELAAATEAAEAARAALQAAEAAADALHAPLLDYQSSMSEGNSDVEFSSGSGDEYELNILDDQQGTEGLGMLLPAGYRSDFDRHVGSDRDDWVNPLVDSDSPRPGRPRRYGSNAIWLPGPAAAAAAAGPAAATAAGTAAAAAAAGTAAAAAGAPQSYALAAPPALATAADAVDVAAAETEAVQNAPAAAAASPAAAVATVAAAAAQVAPSTVDAAPAAAAAAAAAAGPSSSQGQRLTGQRRTWQEACDPEGFEVGRSQQQQRRSATAAAAAAEGFEAGRSQQQQQQGGAGSSHAQVARQPRGQQEGLEAAGVGGQAAAAAAAAEEEEEGALQVAAAAPTPAAAAAAGGGAVQAAAAAVPSAAGDRSRRRSRPVVEYSKVWRTVHDWLTGEDEDLLMLVSQVVPYSLAGRGLRAQGDTLRQLQTLAKSRPVPEKVVTTIADRLQQPSTTDQARLVRLTASSGFSKQAAAAAAVLDCCERHGALPFYVSLAGLCTADSVEGAVMRGLFEGHAAGGQEGLLLQGAELAAAAAAVVAAADTSSDAGMRAFLAAGRAFSSAAAGGDPAQSADAAAGTSAAAAAADEGAAAGAVAATGSQAAAAAAAASGEAASVGHAADNPQDLTLADMQAMVSVLQAAEPAPPPSNSNTAAAATQQRGDTTEAGTQQRSNAAAELLPASGGSFARAYPTLYSSLQGVLLPDMSAGAAAAATGSPRFDPDLATDLPSPSSSSEGDGEDVDLLAAHLTLLGRCHGKQPMLLLLDEVDAAMTNDDGRPLLDVLVQLLSRLPHAVVVITSSSGMYSWRDPSVLRQVGGPLVQDLYDGRLVLQEHALPPSRYCLDPFPCFRDIL